jgi:threonine aldolase
VCHESDAAAELFGRTVVATPYSYKCDRLPKDAEDQMEALLGAAQAGRSVYGTQFNVRAFKHSFLHIWAFENFN